MSLADGIGRFRIRAMNTVQKKQGEVAFELFRRVILKTPVDTGRARMNWQVNFGPSPAPSVYYRTGDPSGEAAIGRVSDEVTSFRPGMIMWLSNNLPYIRVLEYGEYPNPPKSGTGKTSGGYSTQAVGGMVRVTAMEFGSILEAVRPS